MEAYSVLRYQRISSKKLNRIARLVRGIDCKKARHRLMNLPHQGARIILNVLKNASANMNNKSVVSSEDKWKIQELLVSQGPSYKRLNPRARGSADRINRPTAHLKLVLSEMGSRVIPEKKGAKKDGSKS